MEARGSSNEHPKYLLFICGSGGRRRLREGVSEMMRSLAGAGKKWLVCVLVCCWLNGLFVDLSKDLRKEFDRIYIYCEIGAFLRNVSLDHK